MSVTNSPTQSTPGGQYYIYQFNVPQPSGGAPSFCNYLTMGVDYWGIYFTWSYCTSVVGDAGNAMLAINKAPMLNGVPTANAWVQYNALQTSGAKPAFTLSPSIEEGIQDAEFFTSTDAGYGGSSSNMGICAWTNLSNIATTPPTVSCQNVNLGLSYADPLPVRQPGTAVTLTPGYGVKQVYYKAGHFYLAQTTALGGTHDGVFWAEVQPQLTTKAAFNPQHVNGAIVIQTGYLDYGSSYDVYTPTLMGTDENDISLVYNISSAGTLYPTIELVGRKATDAPGTLAQNTGAYDLIASGSHSNTSGSWSVYSACTVTLNSVTRGGIWCGGQYTGSAADPGWNTRLYNFRME